MARKEIALELAAFLDSPQARSLDLSGEELRRVAEALLEACYDGLGKQPQRLDQEDARTLTAELLPAWFAPRDPAVEAAPAIVEAFFDHLASAHVVTHAYEIARGLDEGLPVLLETVRAGRNAERQVARRRDPFVHGAAKLGRNDPCSCGSGKKYKKCHGKNA